MINPRGFEIQSIKSMMEYCETPFKKKLTQYMHKKKILIVCKGFYPQNSPRSFRATELAKELAGEGHNVTVLTPKDEKVHMTFEREHNLTIHDLGKLRWKNPDFGKSRVGHMLTRLFVRSLLMTLEYPDIELMFKVVKALKHERGYDMLISIAVPYPIHWGVAWQWSKNQRIARIWVADCGDPYYGNKLDTFNKWFYFKYIEKWFMRKADFITITNSHFKVNYFTEFHHKMVEIPQGFKFSNIELFEGEINNKIPHFAFAGNVFPKHRDPSKLLSYLISLNQNFRFVFYTKTPGLILPFAEKSKGRIVIKEYIPRNELLYELSKMDFLVNFEFNIHEQSPSKLIDYGITKRPILNVISREFNPSIVDEFLSGDYKNQFKIDGIERYQIENVCKAFLSLVNEIRD